MARTFHHFLKTRGDKWVFTFPVPAGTEDGVTEFAITDVPGNSNLVHLMSPEGGVVVADGYATATLDAADSFELDPAVYPYSLRRVDVDDEATLYRGRLQVRQRIGTSRNVDPGQVGEDGALQFDSEDNSGLLQLLY